MNGENSLAVFANELFLSDEKFSEPTAYDLNLSEIVNGNSSDFVYKTLTVLERKKHGVFFSGLKWASQLRSQVNIERWTRFIDPSVGTGDLLIEVCKDFPLEFSVEKTLTAWSSRLVAIDLRKSFLQITWARIQALALWRHRKIQPGTTINPFPLPSSFRVGDALSMDMKLCVGDFVIMNPPYQRIPAKPGSFVGQGMRSAAALHIENILGQAPAGVGVIALLPDVLRSGSSYKNFRNEIKKRMKILSFDSFGGFGSDADVDVSILVGTSGSTTDEVPVVQTQVSGVLGDKFSVSVGPVVPHRTGTNGECYAYLTARNAIVGSEIRHPTEFGNYECRVERGPFVIVRRTSSPSDKSRARATFVSAKLDFLVENHLLVIRPLNNSVRDCRALMRVLQDKATDEWLNRYIRCRHLTVGALKKLPWSD